MNAGLIGGIAGIVIGSTGGIIGTYFSIRNTESARERAFMIRASVVVWTLGALFLILLIGLSSPYRFLLWIPYSILLPFGIIYGNKTVQRIRAEEAQRRASETEPQPSSTNNT